MEIKICETCLTSFETTDEKTKYCSKVCSNRAVNIYARYRLKPKDVVTMFLKQKGCCAICKVRVDVHELGYFKHTPACIDHLDHADGSIQVRGLLCSGCNKGIGLFLDDVESLENAKLYIERTRKEKL